MQGHKNKKSPFLGSRAVPAPTRSRAGAGPKRGASGGGLGLTDQLAVGAVDDAGVAAFRLEAVVLAPCAATALLPALAAGVLGLDGLVERLGAVVLANRVAAGAVASHVSCHTARTPLGTANLCELVQLAELPHQGGLASDLGLVGLVLAPAHPHQFGFQPQVEGVDVELLGGEGGAIAQGDTGRQESSSCRSSALYRRTSDK